MEVADRGLRPEDAPRAVRAVIGIGCLKIFRYGGSGLGSARCLFMVKLNDLQGSTRLSLAGSKSVVTLDVRLAQGQLSSVRFDSHQFCRITYIR